MRAQLEKRGLMDVLRNQIIERKVLELVQSEAKFKDEPYEPQKNDTEAISMAAGGGAAVRFLSSPRPRKRRREVIAGPRDGAWIDRSLK